MQPLEHKRARRIATLPPYPFSELARLKREAVEEGVDLRDFGIGDPDQPTPAHIVEALCDAAHDPFTHRYDEYAFGLPEFVDAVAASMKRRFGVELATDGEIKQTIGSKEALAHFSWAFVDPGDLAIVPDPRYAVYNTSVTFAGGEVCYVPLFAENDFLVDYSAIDPDTARRAKILFINYPNNPTGAVADLAFFKETIRFAKEYDVIICHDAAYSEVYLADEAPPSILQVEGAKDCCIEFHSLSKTYNMTGWRMGFVAGNRDLVGGLSKLKSNVDSNGFMAVERAAAVALTASQDCVGEMRRTIQERRDWLVDGLAQVGWRIRKPAASYYVWAPVPVGITAADFAAVLLRDAGILVTPGSAYGKNGEGYVRFSLTVLADDVKAYIEEAVERVRKLDLRWD